MKKAEDLCLELKWTYDSDPGRYDLFKGLIEPIVKQTQIDAINETVYMCAEKANIKVVDNRYISIDENTILSVADKLIKEL